jgi:S1-C subfamily serine protease
MARPTVKSRGVPTIVGLALLSLILCPPGLSARQKPTTPTCEVRYDLQYEMLPGTRVTVAGMEVAPDVYRLLANKLVEGQWDEFTKHGRKYPGICLDNEHPYYVLVWSTIDATDISDASAHADLYVLDNGCLVDRPVFDSVEITRSKQKAMKKVFEEALRFLAEKGKQPAPSPISSDVPCVPPEWLGPTKYKLTRGNPTASAQARQSPAIEPASDAGTIIVGTGFFVSEYGQIVTNAHVVSGCKQIQTRDGRAANLLNKDEQIDLALLKIEGESPAVATFRVRPAPRVGDSVVAFGFPLQGILSSEGNLTTGTIAATSGIGDDPRFLQISVPVQPGNSGSPLLDSSGDVIGVVEGKLDAVETLRIAGDIPQNVNFAIQGSEAIRFLERNDVAYRAETSEAILDVKVADVAARVKQFSLPIECLK